MCLSNLLSKAPRQPVFSLLSQLFVTPDIPPSEVKSLLAAAGSADSRIPVEDLQGPVMDLLSRALARSHELGPAVFLRLVTEESGGLVTGESTAKLAAYYADAEGAAQLTANSAELGVPVIALLAAHLVEPFRSFARPWLEPDEWLKLAAQFCALAGALGTTYPAFAARLSDEPAGDPADWRLMRELADALGAFGVRGDDSLVDPLRTKYGLGLTLIPSRDRGLLLGALADAVDRRELSINALLPFIGQDDSGLVVSTAALRFAVAIEPEGGDPLTGVRHLIAHAAGADSEARRVAILSGLLLLGDQRVLDLLGPCWRGLSPEGRVRLSRMTPPYLHDSLIEWFLGWLEDCEGAEFGAVAGALIRMGRAASGQPVYRVRRLFPVPSDPAQPPMEIVQTWSRAEFARRLEPRLRELARLESAPYVMPAVLEAWGLD